MKLSGRISCCLLSLTLACSAADNGDVDGDADGADSGSSGGSVGDSGGSTAATGGATSSGGASSGGAPGSGGAPVDDCVLGAGTEDFGTNGFTDKATCLSWQKTATLTGSTNIRAALAYCNELSQDGFDDWRLPTAQELRSYPGLADAANAYLAGPSYIPTGAGTVAQRCVDNSHSCNLTQYSQGNFACAWQGPGSNPYPVLCVRGTAQVALDAAFAVATCCSSSSTFEQADCAGL